MSRAKKARQRAAKRAYKDSKAPVSMHAEFYWVAACMLQISLGELSGRVAKGATAGQHYGLGYMIPTHGPMLGWVPYGSFGGWTIKEEYQIW